MEVLTQNTIRHKYLAPQSMWYFHKSLDNNRCLACKAYSSIVSILRVDRSLSPGIDNLMIDTCRYTSSLIAAWTTSQGVDNSQDESYSITE